MNCFCLSGKSSKKKLETDDYTHTQKPSNLSPSDKVKVELKPNVKKEDTPKNDQLAQDVGNLNMKQDVSIEGEDSGSRAEIFTFDELTAATRNFALDCFLGEGGFGKVYKGYLQRIDQTFRPVKNHLIGIQECK
ncbi:hypothetical protein Ahy_A03g016815 isoform C [Arachis hypogaea]|uniref:Protein kinase domain-containing protein n=1 Tax=Arachis hypogaea TaxID=3818 RepID=A0A445E4J4_ARAHY|nr:hypothetical protein Ahy_A03g016815 isoform C [Arachis hypogaea]